MSDRKIQDHHTGRIAYVYLRQSSMGQVRFNQESTRRQYALKDKAEKLGWAPTAIKMLDGDLGISGSQSSNREDFKTLVAEVSLGKVGAVFALEASRLSRSCTDWHRLLELCALTEALIIDEDGCYNPSDFNDQLLLGIKGTMSQAELHFIRARLLGGKINKAKRGELCITLPVGYCYNDDKITVFDADEQVRQTIELLFRVFRETGSAYAVTQYFGRNKIQFPKRAYGGVWKGKLVWGNVTHSRVVSVLKNPSYAGSYVYGRYRYRTKLTEDGALNKSTVRLPIDKWHTVIHDHHEAYVSWNEYLENQNILASNQTSHEGTILSSSAREGCALLQGLLICSRCGHRLSIRYQMHGKLCPIYECSWKKNGGEASTSCCFVHGENLDLAVSKRILEVISYKQIDIALKSYEELENRCTSLNNQWAMKIDRAEYESQLAQRRYEEVDPSNRLVASTLEKRWNDTLLNLNNLRIQHTEYCQQSLNDLTKLEKSKILALAGDLPTLWASPTTKMKDRKRIIRLLIKDITVEKLTSQNKALLHILWQGGATEDLEVALPKKSSEKWRHPEELVHKVRELAITLTDEQIVEKLNQSGLKTNKGSPFTMHSISWIRFKHKIPSPRLQKSNELSVNQVAEKFNVSHYVVRYWIERNIVSARHIGTRLWICMDSDKEQELHRLTASSTKIANARLQS